MRYATLGPLLGGVALVAAACSGASTAEVPPEENVTPEPAASATPAEAPSPAATSAALTPTPTPTATASQPAAPIASPELAWEPPLGEYPAGFLRYEPAHYVVYERELHGTTVAVAVHEALTEGRLISGSPGMGPEAYSEFVFEVFERYQGVFGGSPYDRYVVVVRGPDDDPIGYFITSEWGLDVAFAGWELDSTTEHEPEHGYTWPFAKEWTAHEVFHAWNGGFITWEPDGSGLIFQTETWLAEGATVYYSGRARPSDLAFYEELMEDALEDVEETAAEDGWLSFADMAKRVAQPTGDGVPPPYSPYSSLMYQKGALVSYLLDLELREHGATFDEFLRRLYVDFGLANTRYTQADLEAVASEVAGADLSNFFERYVTGAEPLPLDGDFELPP